MPLPLTKEHLEGLLEHGDPTDKQRTAAEAVLKHGNYRAAAKDLGQVESTIAQHVGALKKKAARKGWSPEHGLAQGTAEGFSIKGYSHLTRTPDGEPIWLKADRDEQERYRSFLEGIQDALSRFQNGAPKVKAPSKTQTQRLTVYPVADLHLGAYAWGDECGDDYDSDIAQALIGEAMHRLVETAPPTDECLVLDLGDLVHADNPSNETERSGAKLDVDTRWQRVAEIAALILIHCIEEAKHKHRIVRVRKAFGNHDPNTSRMLNITLKLYYGGDERVIVEDSPKAFWYYRFGKVLLGVTHGDKTKPQDLPGIMAADAPEDWGASTCRMWLTGHIHHLTRKEYPGCVVETFRTLAAKDAYHAHGGYRSDRDMQMLVFDGTGKLRERHHIDIDDIQSCD